MKLNQMGVLPTYTTIYKEAEKVYCSNPDLACNLISDCNKLLKLMNPQQIKIAAAWHYRRIQAMLKRKEVN